MGRRSGEGKKVARDRERRCGVKDGTQWAGHSV